MSLLLAGIDEAGYGPTLGPLCVGFSLFRIHAWSEGDPAPCLWRLCKAGICRKPTDARRRIAIADSKALKLPNDVKSRHPLVHLERGVLALLSTLGESPQTDAELLAHLGTGLPEVPWYDGIAQPLPLSHSAAQIAIAANRLRSGMERGGVELVDARCLIVSEAAVNDAIRRTGTKAEATVAAVGEHLRHLLARPLEDGTHLRIVCDQLGGRTQYQDILARELPSFAVMPLAESGERSRYSIACRAEESRTGPAAASQAEEARPRAETVIGPPSRVIQFMPEAEAHHLPVALASMIAKLVRELAMMRFNRYWCGRMPELKPTAGYYADATRWLRDAAPCLDDADRAALIRRA